MALVKPSSWLIKAWCLYSYSCRLATFNINNQLPLFRKYPCDSKPTHQCGHGILEWISIWILDLARHRLHHFPQEGHQFVDCKEFGWIRRHALIKSPWTCLSARLRSPCQTLSFLRISRESVSRSCCLDCVKCFEKNLIILLTLKKLFTAEREAGI